MVKMITPSFALTATERVLPRMALDFTTATLDPRVTFTRTGNTATVTNSSGVIASINADLPRFDFDPTTLVCKGLLIEEARTNLLLNSLIDGTSLSTQLVTTTAVSQTLSFYGTGQIVLTGTSSATVVGTGAYPARQTLTFTPTVGVLTLTVTGTVQYAQLEVGAFVTSFIPTDGTTKTRNADVATMTGTNFSDWFNASEGAFAIWCSVPASAVSFAALSITDGTNAERILINVVSGRAGTSFRVVDGNVDQANISKSAAWTAGQQLKIVGAYKLNSFATTFNGASVVTDTAGTIPTVSRLGIGNSGITIPVVASNFHVQKILYWPQRIIDAEVQAFSK
jgi:hypothetical protein